MFKQIKDFNGLVCFIGLPCHIHALRKAQRILPWLKQKVVFTMGLFCSGTPGINATRYFLNAHHIKQKMVQSLVYCSEGWPGEIEVFLKGKKKPVRFPRGKANSFTDHLTFATAFHHDGAFFHPRCSLCPDYFAELSDISLGDAWNLKLDSDGGGWNAGLIRTRAGMDVIENLKQSERIVYEALSPDKLLKSHLSSLETRKNLRSAMDYHAMLGFERPHYTGQPEGYSNVLLSIFSRIRGFQKKTGKLPSKWKYLWLLTLTALVLKKICGKLSSKKNPNF